MKTYIHYGHKEFDKEAFKPVRNWPFRNKPYGGLWASPTECKYGWKQFCEFEGFRTGGLDDSFTFTLREDAKVLVIDSVEKAYSLPKTVVNAVPNDVYSMATVDWERIKAEYDAVEVPISKVPRLHYAMDGWSCDTLLVLNKDIVVPCIEKSITDRSVHPAALQEQAGRSGSVKQKNVRGRGSMNGSSRIDTSKKTPETCRTKRSARIKQKGFEL